MLLYNHRNTKAKHKIQEVHKMSKQIEMMSQAIERTGNEDIINEWYHVAYCEVAVATGDEYWFNKAVDLFNYLMAA